jgi:hypothetical protein
MSARIIGEWSNDPSLPAGWKAGAFDGSDGPEWAAVLDLGEAGELATGWHLDRDAAIAEAKVIDDALRRHFAALTTDLTSGI